MRFIACFLTLVLMTAVTAQAAPEYRTSGRSLTGETIIPDHLIATDGYEEFSPDRSNADPHHQHPQQWRGQDWDVSAWEGSGWTADRAIKRLFDGNIFKEQYVRGGKQSLFTMVKKEAEKTKATKEKPRQPAIPVLVVGPRFYQLSGLDQGRSVKLAVDHAKLFEQGYRVIELHDWYNKKVVGVYTARGLQMN